MKFNIGDVVRLGKIVLCIEHPCHNHDKCIKVNSTKSNDIGIIVEIKNLYYDHAIYEIRCLTGDSKLGWISEGWLIHMNENNNEIY